MAAWTDASSRLACAPKAVSLDFDLAFRLATALLSLSAKDELGSGSAFCLAYSRPSTLHNVTAFIFALAEAGDQLLQDLMGLTCPQVLGLYYFTKLQCACHGSPAKHDTVTGSCTVTWTLQSAVHQP